MNKNTYILETPFTEGDIVYNLLEPETLYVVYTLELLTIDENGIVINYCVKVGDSKGVMHSFYPYELQIKENANYKE